MSVVTPSFNQARFLEAAMRSVLDQGYPDLEYVVMDGGSTDGSVGIIERLADRLAYWTSGPDSGQYDAVNKGFARTTGEIMAWLNSDDMYTPWALHVAGEVFATFPEIEWLTTLYPLAWDADGRAVRCLRHEGYSRRGFLKGEYLPGGSKCATGWIQQESTFWRRPLWERAGGRVDASLRLAGDFELWARFFEHAELYGVGTPLGGFRFHEAQKTAQRYDEYVAEALEVLRRHGGSPCGRLRGFLRHRILGSVGRRLRPLAFRLRLTRGRPVCLYSGREGRWKIMRR